MAGCGGLQAAESFALTLVEWGWVSPALAPRRTDVVLFAAATAAIMHCCASPFLCTWELACEPPVQTWIVDAPMH